ARRWLRRANLRLLRGRRPRIADGGSRVALRARPRCSGAACLLGHARQSQRRQVRANRLEPRLSTASLRRPARARAGAEGGRLRVGDLRRAAASQPDREGHSGTDVRVARGPGTRAPNRAQGGPGEPLARRAAASEGRQEAIAVAAERGLWRSAAGAFALYLLA